MAAGIIKTVALFAGFIYFCQGVLIRLPESVIPVHYQLTVIPVMEQDQRLCGHVWIHISVLQPTKTVILHASELILRRIQVIPSDEMDDEDKVNREVEDLCFFGDQMDENRLETDMFQSFKVNATEQLVVIELTEELHPEDRYKIGLLYTGEVNDDVGFFRKPYTRAEIDCCKRWVGATQLEAVNARKVFPCFDEPAFKAPFQLTIGHSISLKAISNMPLDSTTTLKKIENWVFDKFKTSPPMPTYIVAFVLTELDFIETWYRSIDGRNVTLRLWTLEHKLDQLEMAVMLVPKVLSALEEYLAMPYSLPKLDIIAIPGYEAGRAMENWGLIVHNEGNLLSESKLISSVDRTLVAITIVHELAHQWFGNLVTSRWWDDIWVNEGFATFFENLIMNKVAPEMDADEIMVLFYEQALSHDHIAASNPINFPVELLPSVDDKFDGFAYVKGSSIFRMLKSFIGEHAFRNALRRYFNQYQFKNALSTDLWVLMNQEARRNHTISGRMNIFRIMKTWTHQPGYPVIHVERRNDLIYLTQKPFIDWHNPLKDEFRIGNSSYSNARETAKWWIPISMTHSRNPSFKDTLPVAWLTPNMPSTEIPDPVSRNDSWILVNLESTGYYRVNYDIDNWQLLTQQLMSNFSVIPAISRAQLIDDAFSLGHSNLLPYEVAIKLINYIGSSPDELSFIRKVVMDHISKIQSILALNTIQLGLKDDHLEDLVKRAYSSISGDVRKRSGRKKLEQGSFQSCLAVGGEVCVSDVLKLFRSLTSNSLNVEQTRILMEHFEEVWCAVVRHGGQSEWDFAWEKTNENFNSITGKRKMMKALSCTKDPAKQKQLLSRVFHPDIQQSPKETLLILSSIAESHYSGRILVLNFVLRNWNFLKKHFRNSLDLRNIFIRLVEQLETTEDIEKVKQFLIEVDDPSLSDIIFHNRKIIVPEIN